ncbi:T9SS type A sorting domain-containing protein [Chryseobacterium pennipullorum]|uniref:Secretion system C-terminal sorting domain-containing protein n=1 Tax=Chryseobacterium pennipullorum TaxID=2258963 RepID=A0A3D9AYB1_9FLAO|nr:T9SS type A sorting domain-containing protein [Chryseobacterium pennipullorum]REC46280.1 hypothetical protein DRF67_14930 [Chryseobacterium pennipullorum]
MRKIISLLLLLPLGFTAQTLPYMDTSFNGYGRVNLSIWNNNYIGCTAVQPDKKVLIGGSTHMNDPITKSSPLIARYNENGTPDPTFGINGLLYDVNGPGGSISDIKILSDGKMIIAGAWGYSAFIGRLLPDGTFDNSFGTQGKTNVSSITVRKIEILQDGSIVGFAISDWSAKLIKMNSDGQIDTTFGVAGESAINIGFTKIIGNAMTRQPDGKIIVGGAAVSNSSYPETNQLFLARYHSNGTKDTSFGNNGLLLYSQDAREVRDIAFTASGKILVLGEKPYASTTSIGPTSMFYLLQFNIDGTLDTMFNNTGSVPFGYNYYSSIKIDSQNKIYVSGSNFTYNNYYHFKRIMRLNEDGSFDTTFGTNGRYDTTSRVYPSEYKSLNTMSFAPDGKMVVAGHANLPNFTMFALRLGISQVNLSVSDVSADVENISVYPNPTQDYFLVKSKDDVLTLELTNNLGQNIFKSEKTTKLEVYSIPAGNYFLKVKTAKEEKTFKVIKK